jgi:hypothetical protein
VDLKDRTEREARGTLKIRQMLRRAPKHREEPEVQQMEVVKNQLRIQRERQQQEERIKSLALSSSNRTELGKKARAAPQVLAELSERVRRRSVDIQKMEKKVALERQSEDFKIQWLALQMSSSIHDFLARVAKSVDEKEKLHRGAPLSRLNWQGLNR